MIAPRPKYHWVPDIPDTRDHVMLVSPRVLPELPKSVDLRPKLSAVEWQGPISSCLGHAYTPVLEMYWDEKMRKELAHPQYHLDLSRLFLYYNARKAYPGGGFLHQDAGARMRDGIKALARWGVCSEALWPYREDLWDVEPPPICQIDAMKRRICSYARAKTLADVKWALAKGVPVVFGCAIYDSFESTEVATTGVVPLPKLREKWLGGHAMLIVGYDDDAEGAYSNRGRILVRNSWGPWWGAKGYCTMPYDYLDPDLTGDMWVIYNEWKEEEEPCRP